MFFGLDNNISVLLQLKLNSMSQIKKKIRKSEKMKRWILCFVNSFIHIYVTGNSYFRSFRKRRFLAIDNELIKRKLGKKNLVEFYASFILQYFPNFSQMRWIPRVNVQTRVSCLFVIYYIECNNYLYRYSK